MKLAFCPPRWPKGYIYLLMLVGYLAGTAIAFFPQSRVGPLQWLFDFGLSLFRGERSLRIVMGLASVAHAVESVMMVRKCRQLGLSASHTMGWWGLTMLLGFGAFEGMKQQISDQKKQRK